jgi:hypothetical protein
VRFDWELLWPSAAIWGAGGAGDCDESEASELLALEDEDEDEEELFKEAELAEVGELAPLKGA